MAAKDIAAASTRELTDSFGWQANEQNVQHDVFDLIRELFNVLDRALKATAFEGVIKQIYG